MVPKHCSTQKRRFEISLLKRFSEVRSGWPRTAFRMIPSRCLPSSRLLKKAFANLLLS